MSFVELEEDASRKWKLKSTVIICLQAQEPLEKDSGNPIVTEVYKIKVPNCMEYV